MSSNTPSFYSLLFFIVVFLRINTCAFSLPPTPNNQQNQTEAVVLTIEGIYSHSRHSIQINFSHPLDTARYNPSKTTLHPMKNLVSGVFLNPTSLVLTYTSTFINSNSYQLIFTGLLPVNGKATTLTTNFVFYLPAFGELIITEFLTDPSPVVGLPEKEYIEIFNRTNTPLNLSGISLEVNDKNIPLPPFTLPVNNYTILCEEIDTAEFPDNILRIPTLKLPNLPKEAGTLRLMNSNKELIHYIAYTKKWYNSAEKYKGGWSLEMIDQNNYCTQQANWTESVEPSGGTPGQKNSVVDVFPDEENPSINWVSFLTDSSLLIKFSEIIPPDIATNLSVYALANQTTRPVNVRIYENNPLHTQLLFSQPFKPQAEYVLQVRGLKDCQGNTLNQSNRYPLSLPGKLKPGDLVINEIMYEPENTMSEFIEVYNTSTKYINLSDVALVMDNMVADDGAFSPLSAYAIPLQPGGYAVLSDDTEGHSRQYNIPDNVPCIIPASFPTLRNSGASLSLIDSLGNLVDNCMYNPDFHFSLVRITRGVSLEKNHPLKPGTEKESWSSASENTGFASPGKQNSQFIKSGKKESFSLNFSTDVISPNGDGFHDALQIEITCPKEETILNVSVFDQHGRFIGSILTNYLCGKKNQLNWNGMVNSKYLFSGIYIIFFEAFDADGATEKIKKTCIIAR